MKRPQVDAILFLIPLVLLGCFAASVVMHQAGLAFLSLVGALCSVWLLDKLTNRDE